MSVPAKATDSKDAALLEQTSEEAPPSYSETSTSTSSAPPPLVIGDGNVFSDLPRPGMTYSRGQREDYVPRSERKGTWTFGLFDCFRDPGATAKACLCPCVSYGQTRHRLHSPGTDAPICSSPCIGYGLTCCLFPGAESIFGLLQRNELRQRLNIDQKPASARIRLGGPGSGGRCGRQIMFENVHQAAGFLDDTWKHLFCGCCALAQEDREVRRWESEWDEGVLESFDQERENVDEEGERLLGSERAVLRGLRG